MDQLGLDFDITVPRRLVHRASVTEVFLTDHRPQGNGALIAAQLPRTHDYYNDHTATPAKYDPLLLMEVLRQCGILTAHEYVGAPADSSFVFDGASLRVLCAEALTIGSRPARATVDFQVKETKERAGAPCGAVYVARLDIEGRPAAEAMLECRWMPRRVWQKLRERSRSALDLSPRARLTGQRLPGYLVGRRSPQNVVLADATVGGTTGEGTSVVGHVVVDQGHLGLFDHPLDHISGAVMFEAFRQTALYAASEVHGLAPRGLFLERMETRFVRVAEFELPTDCRARVGASDETGVSVDLELVQEERVTATARVRLGRSLSAALVEQETGLVSA
ncbi:MULTISPECIES: ScbA/BarX family gamma-butyrolactone biosynthesis protein [unclassified Streptomyces]|uniref:ScbA/BarX family gamma-butyrolactone biosynthesis protein n=1 Tax=Streptomyces evansiae TaxID=3075535 RepID=A0ABU2QUD0_9ACTN|nr:MULTISPECIES: ScbA/BarX family gamma-butyrolactone biosynthesis protein [unclassified Streptomyces]EFL02060.1 gamma-butyrolactone biosynthesis protein [Streptomyces sp. SPB78]MDT0407613.1 ScbA/BarX family gamma-butyrolactone biosynthesis protein [Streptomyces sp. DSM 41979]MDT0421370.1 ScbA/BarX family gamma-butyrolactone biosynthesis protein [Streptomyces sp. DSM 41859]MYQ61113.1 gamma-butyrolactone biosynthesis protein [Streptomyces sp. SID4926]MYR28866.1 gamma-butyrolactone biosynthesis 